MRRARRCRRSALLLMLGVSVSTWKLGEAWWTPGPGVSWQWQISGELALDLDVDMYNLDLSDVTEAEVASLQQRGVIVICSFSAGTIAADSVEFENVTAGPPSIVGASVEGTNEEEWWIDITSETVLGVMLQRLDLAVNKSCDGVDPSNIEVFAVEGSGLNITAESQVAYNMWLADEAHMRNLSIGLRNDWTQLEELESSFDWALSENCLAEGECETYHPNFVLAEKAVLDAEYFQFDSSFCENITASGLDVIIKDPSLDRRRCSCQNPSTDIDCDELLNQSSATTSAGSSYWVIAVAVGASIFILVASAGVAIWRRRKYGGGGGDGATRLDFR